MKNSIITLVIAFLCHLIAPANAQVEIDYLRQKFQEQFTTLDQLLREDQNIEHSVREGRGLTLQQVSQMKLSRSKDNIQRIEKVSLTPQFGQTKNQGQVGTCVTFANMSLIEAAYYREFGSKVQFSEMSALSLPITQSLSTSVSLNHGAGGYLGMAAETILLLGRAGRLCRSSTFKYNERSLRRFDSYMKPEKKIYTSPEETREDILHYLGIFDFKSEAMKACIAEGNVFRGQMANFKEILIPMNGWFSDMDRIRAYIELGLPVGITVTADGGGGANEIQIHGTSHRIVLVGFDESMNRFMIRNSWGTNTDKSNLVHYQRIRSSMKELVKREEGYYANTVVSQSDLKRICALEQHFIPDEIIPFCD
jgi:hypothetical protein